jgi:hypothetical protein
MMLEEHCFMVSRRQPIEEVPQKLAEKNDYYRFFILSSNRCLSLYSSNISSMHVLLFNSIQNMMIERRNSLASANE